MRSTLAGMKGFIGILRYPVKIRTDRYEREIFSVHHIGFKTQAMRNQYLWQQLVNKHLVCFTNGFAIENI